jgi:hypothetical protein
LAQQLRSTDNFTQERVAAIWLPAETSLLEAEPAAAAHISSEGPLEQINRIPLISRCDKKSPALNVHRCCNLSEQIADCVNHILATCLA